MVVRRDFIPLSHKIANKNNKALGTERIRRSRTGIMLGPSIAELLLN
jgi:hypothetical protein